MLRRGSLRPEDTLRAKGAEILECAKPRAERGGLKGFQPDVTVGWKYWEQWEGSCPAGGQPR